MDDRLLMMLANLFAVVAGFTGIWSARNGRRSRWTVVWMTVAFAVQCIVLSVRGEAHGRCPIVGLGEIFFFLAWALTGFYLIVGSAYRLSYLGIFTAPVVVVFQQLAVLPGIYREAPAERVGAVDTWLEAHASFSVLSYGALGLAAIAGVMFLVQDKRLKRHDLGSFSLQMPPVRLLATSIKRLTWLALVLLSVGIACGLFTPAVAPGAKLWVASGVWLALVGLVLIAEVRGLPPKHFAKATVALFICSLVVLFLR